MTRSVLLLNQNYIPIGVIGWKKAVGLVIGREKAHILKDYEGKRPDAIFDAAVVRLTVKSPDPYSMWEKQKFSKRNVFLRDKYICQYCEIDLSSKSATLDHVLPRAQGGTTTYMNCVTSCKKCNAHKGDRTPEQASMPLKVKIRKPNLYDVFNGYREIPGEWVDYLPHLSA